MPSIDDDHFLARRAADADVDGLSKPHHTDGDGDECSGAKSQETHNTEEEEEGRRYLNDSKNTSFPLCLYLSFAFQKQQRRQTVQEFKCGIDYLCCNIIPALSRKNSRLLPAQPRRENIASSRRSVFGEMLPDVQ